MNQESNDNIYSIFKTSFIMYPLYFSVFITIINFIAITEGIDYEKCDSSGLHFYEEIACKSKTGNKTECPSSYDCPEYTVSPDFCPFLGKRYRAGSSMNETSYCNVGCFCRKPEPLAKERYASVTCASISCPRVERTEENAKCYPKRALKKCCSTDLQCPPFENLATCKYNGKTYKEGEMFRPTHACYNCVCRNGFKGVFEEPFCIRTPCDVEIKFSQKIARKCAPLYRVSEKYPALCCPINFICGEDVSNIEVISKDKDQDDKKEDLSCKFKETTMRIGDLFYTSYKLYGKERKVICSCIIPPLPACTFTL